MEPIKKLVWLKHNFSTAQMGQFVETCKGWDIYVSSSTEKHDQSINTVYVVDCVAHEAHSAFTERDGRYMDLSWHVAIAKKKIEFENECERCYYTIPNSKTLSEG